MNNKIIDRYDFNPALASDSAHSRVSRYVVRQIADSIANAAMHHSVKQGSNGALIPTRLEHIRESLPPIIYKSITPDVGEDKDDVDGYVTQLPKWYPTSGTGAGHREINMGDPTIVIKPAPLWNNPTYRANLLTGKIDMIKAPIEGGKNILAISPSKMGRRLRAISTAMTNRYYAATNALSGARETHKELEAADDMVRTVMKDLKPELSDDLSVKLETRLPSYLLWGGGGSILGRLIAGKNNRLLGYGLGGLTGLVANYLRRKSYYGDLVGW